nr:nicotinamide-nucleotide amidohydrolase family protein [Cellulomonas sp. JH27-2]
MLDLLRSRGMTVATAESLTGGELCSRLVDVAGASDVVRGGVVTYATDTKTSVLGVDAELLARRGPVDPDVARAMARGVRRLLGADVGVATTGVAGPGPSDGHDAGTVFVAVARGPGDGDDLVDLVRELHLTGGRDVVRDGAVRAALALVTTALGVPGGSTGPVPG